MRKLRILLVTGVISCWIFNISAQSSMVITENFDGNTNTFTSSPASAWKIDTNYYVSSPNSIRGVVPNMMGDSIILTSSVYDLSDYNHVLLRFNHICKVAPQDITRIEYKISGQGWRIIPASSYAGKAVSQSGMYEFNTNSYLEWMTGDSLSFPSQSWWKEEMFDVSFEVGGDYQVQFRFVIQHGNTPATQISYGWLLDDIEIIAASHEITPPIVELIAPFVQDTVYSAGPWEINAKVKTQTSAPIETPHLEYIARYDGITIASSSILMTYVEGDSLWKADIPQFVFGVEVQYMITGKDTIGNAATVGAKYMITTPLKGGYSGEVTIGTAQGFILNSPYTSHLNRSWSRAIYYDWEFNPQKTGALIANIAYNHVPYVSYSAIEYSTVYRLSIYVKATTDTIITTNSFVNPLLDGATLVWGEATHSTYQGWNVFTFHTPFYLPPGQHLMVYWLNDDGLYLDNSLNADRDAGTAWFCTPQPVNNHIEAVGFTRDFAAFNLLSVNGNRPDIQVFLLQTDFPNNSAALHAIDINDTILSTTGLSVPVIATIKNKGDSTLTSASIYYSINGSTPQQHNWTGNLLWDMNAQDTIGYYTPKQNGWDTLTVWISMPNGVTDSTASDDTLTKMIYGSYDIIMGFINPPTDTLSTTGPFEINARIHTLSGTAVGTVSLNVLTTTSGIINQSTLPMIFDIANNQWKTIIPQIQYGSHVGYSITLTDIAGNVVTITDSFYVKRMEAGVTGYVTIGTGLLYFDEGPINLYFEYSWSRQLYLGTEFSPGASGGIITKLAFEDASIYSWSRDFQSCYFRAVDDIDIINYNWEDPIAAGGTQVWQGSISSAGHQWAEITLDNPFLLPPGKNLLIYWHNQSNIYSNYGMQWKHTATTQYMAVHAYDYSVFPPVGSAPNLTKNRPDARFYIDGGINMDTSVALVAIESPLSIETAGASIPVRVQIRNKGMLNLNNCILNWTKNGVLQQPSVPYTGNLPEDFTDTITIGYYTPVINQRDTIVVWVSTPNGILDSIAYDDTLQIISLGCAGNLAGTKTVGAGGNFPTLNTAIDIISNCGLTGDLTLQLKGTFIENVDLTALGAAMNGYHLTITSLDNHPDSAIILPASGVGVTLGNNKDITIKAITIDVTTATNAIQFTATCTNIVIRDCRLLADTITGGNTLIYKAEVTGMVDSIFIINNLLRGGNYGLSFMGGNTILYGTNVVFDSNTVSNQYTRAIYGYSTNFKSISYNQIIGRTANANGGWIGIYLTSCDGNIIANHILQQNHASSFGIYIDYFNSGTDMGIISNNEIILHSAASGIYTGPYTKAKILHNSIYVSGSGSTSGINITGNDYFAVKNNNIVMESPSAYPISFYEISQNRDIDYNNMYAPCFLGYAIDRGITTSPIWQQIVPTDQHSVRISPNFANPLVNLKPLKDFDLLCNVIPDVTHDIDGVLRTGLTMKGCYEISPTTGNATLKEFIGLRDGYIPGQIDGVKVVVENRGASSLTAVNLSWSINGNAQTTANYPVSLVRGQADTITLGTITYAAGIQTIKVWVNNINNGSLTDEYAGDDTLSTTVAICSAPYNGTFIIGNGGDFPDIDVAYNALSVCGVNGDITLAFLPGTYNVSLDLSNNTAIFGNYHLTLTSSTNNATDVHFVSLGGIIFCHNTRNITIKHITMNVVRGYGIHIGNAFNITIDNCHILANTTTTTDDNTCIYKQELKGLGLDTLQGFTVKNCIIDGGYYGINFIGSLIPSNFCRDIIIDSNTFTNQARGAIFLVYTSANSISYNTFTPRLANTSTMWQALYGHYLRNGGNIIGNRILANNSAITNTLSGMYLTSIDSALIANNEIYLNGNATTTDGIYMNSPREVSIINNSIYTVKSGTTGTNRAHYNYMNANLLNVIYTATIKNNLFIAQGGGAATTYAFYFAGTLANYNNYGAGYEVDYNNYYSSGNNIGYVAGGNRANLAAWQTAASRYDANSASILPDFSNPAVDLRLTNYPDTLSCLMQANVTRDIDDMPRYTTTPMGAYTGFSAGQDLMLVDIAAWNTEVINNQTVAINATIVNNGNVPVTSATFGWSLNGVDKGNISWTTSSLVSLAQQTVFIGSFTASNTTPDYHIVVWIEEVNGQADTINWNDTLRVSAALKPLAEFVSPVIPDTTLSVLFPVNVFIRSWTGVTLTPPQMIFTTTVHGNQTIYDTVQMAKVGDTWQAMIPQQHYDSKVVYSLTLSDTIGNNLTIMDSTYIPNLFAILNDSTLSILSLANPLTMTSVGCSDDYEAVEVVLENKSTVDYRFSKDTLTINYEITNPLHNIYKDSIAYTGVIPAGTTDTIELIPSFALLYAGAYDIKLWLSSPSDNTPYDTLSYTYISNRTPLPIDENFSDSIPTIFTVQGDNTPAMWQKISQGTGADTVVNPVFGSGMIAFSGSRGAMTTLSTRQMDLIQTVQPSLSFWYFHDTIPCEDYTDVRITIDGGTTYNTLFSLTKYDPVYGWKQYSIDLPGYAINQCVALVFEAMEKSNGDVTQYIDRILITAKQDIAISEIITSELAACDLENKEVKVVLSNLTDPILDFVTTPTTLTLEILETGQTYTHLLDSGSLGRFASDTISIATGVNFTKGTYTLKAYFSSVLDVDRMNDTLVRSIVINPSLSVSIQAESGGNTNCLTGELVINPTITLYNTGNMDLYSIDMILQVDTGENNPAVYALLKEIYTGTILAGDTATYMFTNSSYSVPWNARYDVRTYAYLSCDSALANSTNMVQECVDIKDLYIVSIDNPLGVSDAIGTTINAMATLHNRSDNDLFSNSNITVLVEDSKGVQTESFTENLPTIGTSATVSHTFTRSYTVPNDSVYYLTVFVNSQDNYRNNDTMTIRRETVSVGIETSKSIGGLTLYQNIPNPANNSTHIDYSIPESGEVVFNLHSVSGQLLYSKTIEAASGKQSLELNTSSFAAGIYFYSIEYKGQRLVKRMIVQ